MSQTPTNPTVDSPSSPMAEDVQLAHQIAEIVDERLAAGLTDLVKSELEGVVRTIVQNILISNTGSDSNVATNAAGVAQAVAPALAGSQQIGTTASSAHVNSLEGVLVEDNLTDITRGVSGAGFKFCANLKATKAIFLEKQAAKRTCVVTDGVDVSFTLATEDSVLFP
ncbi:hypothetical protein PM082_023639 [Marasmius tenuissimus]|nr:hypothetical protein PM082_023639 [Marasmius tenuissimus]